MLRKGTTDKRSRNGSNRIRAIHNAKPLPSQPQRHQVANDNLGKHDDPAAADTLNTAANEQRGEVFGQRRGEHAGEEKHHGNDHQRLAAEDVGKGADVGLEDRRGEEEGCPDPEGFERGAVELPRDDLWGFCQLCALGRGDEWKLEFTGRATDRAVPSRATIKVRTARVTKAM